MVIGWAAPRRGTPEPVSFPVLGPPGRVCCSQSVGGVRDADGELGNSAGLRRVPELPVLCGMWHARNGIVARGKPPAARELRAAYSAQCDGYQRQAELAGRGLWLAVQEIADRGERPDALRLVHHQHPRLGGNGRDQ